MGNKGMTLIEVMVGLFVFGVVSVTVMQVLILSNRLIIEADMIGEDEDTQILSEFAMEMLLDNIEELQPEGTIEGAPAIAAGAADRVISYTTTGSALKITVRRDGGVQFFGDVNVMRIDVAVEAGGQGSNNENKSERTLFLYEK